MEHTIGPLSYTIRSAANWLEVDYTGVVADVDIARQWMAAIEAELRREGKTKILWDSRGAEVHPSEVREWIWNWLKSTTYLKFSAILVESSLLRVTANMSALSSKVPIRSFHDRSEAVEWLQSQ
ncbi:MAG: STAS/SEC14 domain-containing protein [Myxococcota bacterium]